MTGHVAVAGLWHLGSVTAAGLASAGHAVVGFDPDPARVARLREGRAPLLEPGVEAALASGLASGRLAFTSDAAEAARDAGTLWIAADTPLDADGRGDVAGVRALVDELLRAAPSDALVLISSQVPVGFTRSLEQAFPGRRFACLPENLRLGGAMEAFLRPERVLAGVRSAADRDDVAALTAPLGWTIEWLSVESAEMAKHALGAHLAASVALANEVARLCEATGADARQVERALRGDPRVGPRAYVSPGAAFAGGTLARELHTLADLARAHGLSAPLVDGVVASNALQRDWLLATVRRTLGGVPRPVCAVLGLVYTPGTSTLRGSSALELCARLAAEGVAVRAHDPALAHVPGLPAGASLCATAGEALRGADVAVVATPWPEYRALAADTFAGAMRRACVVDPGWLLAGALERDARIRYFAAGRPTAG
jgi:UDPglucose 6-dehydrogenase